MILTVNNCEEGPLDVLKRTYGNRLTETIWREICLIDSDFYEIDLIEHDGNLSFYNVEQMEGNHILIEDWFDPTNESHRTIVIAALNREPYEMIIPDNVYLAKNWKDRLLYKLLNKE